MFHWEFSCLARVHNQHLFNLKPLPGSHSFSKRQYHLRYVLIVNEEF